ncbi:hypothetical protein A1O3_02262 [Capronia epimyces CBS 606.96]|uniref:Uncharacterized protein n=1 Tax=Capronia epimyces CBS 606.96 TaxID=1182542 RepID=W9YIW7_9EURO|nr:uncharacterized protein A1O3_02262 [Capronia epimyces CBS 606.96]EXJ89196.1 hypothetical protein A1O3_02262 [Capronia epimyces CBS 606.96]
MVTTRAQEKKIHETPKSSASQNGSLVVTATPVPSGDSPGYFTPATSKPARIVTQPTLLEQLENDGNEAMQEAPTPQASQGDDSQLVVEIRSQPPSEEENSAGGDVPSKAWPTDEEKIPSVSDGEPASDINTELPQRPKAPELYFTPMTTSKRKRFDGDGADDSTLEPESLQEQTPNQPGREDSEIPETEDEDDAPEVLSSKAAAQQALSTPIPPSRSSTRKRKKTSVNADAGVATSTLGNDSTPKQVGTERDFASLSQPLEAAPRGQSDETPIEMPAELISTSSHGALENPPAPLTPGEVPAPLFGTHQENTDAATASSSIDTAQVDQAAPVKALSDVQEEMPSAVSGDPIPDPEIVDADVRMDDWQGSQDVNDGSAVAGSNAQIKSDDVHIPSYTPTTSSQQKEKDVVPDLEIATDVAMPTVQAESASSASGRDRFASQTRPKPRPSRLPAPQAKATSLQNYRESLLNRHPRTTKWGPRRARFVGV